MLLLQVASGKGVLGQLSLETGLPTGVIELGLVGLIGYNLVAVRLEANAYAVFS